MAFHPGVSMVSYYQHLAVAEAIRAAFGPLANPFDAWNRHDVFRFESTKISQLAPVLRQAEDGRELVLMRWGLVPGWFKGDAAQARRFQGQTFNARGETMWEKASFRQAARQRRCLVPAVSFTEHRGTGKDKRPVRIGPADGGVLAFGGLWERWTAPGEDEPWFSFSIVTTEPNGGVAPLHHRMPLVLPPSAWAAWLDARTPVEEVTGLVRPADDDVLVVLPQDAGPTR